MASEFVADAAERIVLIARALGVDADIAGQLASQWQQSVIADWGGERAYIGKSNESQRLASRRHAAIVRDWSAGERTAALARKHNLSGAMVRRIVAGERANGQGATALP